MFTNLGDRRMNGRNTRAVRDSKDTRGEGSGYFLALLSRLVTSEDHAARVFRLLVCLSPKLVTTQCREEMECYLLSEVDF